MSLLIDISFTGEFVVPCYLLHSGVSTRHYHCPLCEKITKRRKEKFAAHIVKCCKTPLPKEATQRCQPNDASNGLSNRADASSVLPRKGRKKVCPICRKTLGVRWFKSHLRRHRHPTTQQISSKRHHYTVSVDRKYGIFCSSINMRGRQTPVHIQKMTSGISPVSVCEHHSCMELKKVAERGNNISFECNHIKSIPYAVAGENVSLSLVSLQALRDANFITEERHIQCVADHAMAEKHGCPLLVKLPPLHLASQRYIHLSIYVGRIRYWSRLNRTVLTYDTEQSTISCRCTRSKRYCSHKVIGKWYLYQIHPHLFQRTISHPESDDNDSDSVMLDDDIQEEHNADQHYSVGNTVIMEYPPEGELLLKMLHYIKKFKTIPATSIQKASLVTTSHSSGDAMVPDETECVHCDCLLPEETLISRSGTIISMQKIIKGRTKLILIIILIATNAYSGYLSCLFEFD